IVNLVLLPPEFALAAIAAPSAFFAAVIGAGILGAMGANRGRRLAANAACEDGGLGHDYGCPQFGCVVFFLAAVGFAGVCLVRIPRHLCASLSATSNSCSLVTARSVIYWRSLSRFAEFSAATPISKSPTAGF